MEHEIRCRPWHRQRHRPSIRSTRDGTTPDFLACVRRSPSRALATRAILTSVALAASFVANPAAKAAAGFVWSWGENTYGQLGFAPSANQFVPVLSSMADAVAVDAGFSHCLAVKADGTVWAWGRNDYGQLGVGPVGDQSTPVQVSGLADIIAVAAGNTHSLALQRNGTVFAWGGNAAGQLGNGTTTNSNVPVVVSGLTNATTIAAGGDTSLAIRSDGTAWAWGDNYYGHLGDGTTTNSSVPVPVSGLTNATAVSSGISHAMALASDGTVWCWGMNSDGQLGTGTTVNSATPVQVSGLSGVAAIEAGFYHGMALLTDGSIRAWGDNTQGQLGNGTTVDSSTPIAVSGLTGVTCIAGGYNHSLAVKSDGTVWSWGLNWGGQLGTGTGASQLSPVQARTVEGASQVSAGWTDSFAIAGTSLRFTTQPSTSLPGVALPQQPVVSAYKGDGTPDTAFAGTVSLAIAADTGTPGAVLSGTTSVAATGGVATFSGLSINAAGTGYRLMASAAGCPDVRSAAFDVGHAPVLTPPASQTAYRGIAQAFAVGSITDSGNDGPWSVTVGWGDGSANTTLSAIATGVLPRATHTYAATADYTISVTVTDRAGGTNSVAFAATVLPAAPAGTLLAWGENELGKLGDGTTTGRLSPVVALMAGATAVSAGDFHTAALKPDGTVWTWGGNNASQLGNGWYNSSSVPVQVVTNALPMTPLTNIASIAAGAAHTLAVDSAGHLWSWGGNGGGELGVGTTSPSAVALRVMDPANTALPLGGIAAVAAGPNTSLVLKDDGTVLAFGANSYGQLGDGTTTNRLYPVPVPGLSDVTALAASLANGLAAKSDGSVWIWGANWYGQLCNGSTADRHTAGQVPGLTGVIAIAAGQGHCLALKGDGTVWAWGLNNEGQVGDGTWTTRIAPVQVVAAGGAGLTDVIAIESGPTHSLALKADGTVWVWGANASGQLGSGTTIARNVATQMPGITGVIQVTGAWAQSFALLGSRLSFSTQPAGGEAGAALTTQPVVQVLTTTGAIDTAFSGEITLAIAPLTGPAGAVLSGTTTVTAVSGVAAFADLAIDAAGTGYVLSAAAAGYNSARSAPFDVAGVEPCVEPAITTHPSGAVKCAMSSLVLSVEATGTPPLAYQWYHDTATPENAIPGANEPAFETTAPGTYLAVVSNDCGSTASTTATFAADVTAPVISALPEPSTIHCPATPVFTVPTVVDDYDPAPAVGFHDVTTPGSCPQAYTITRFWTAVDVCNNIRAATQVITVVDDAAPVITLPPSDLVLSCFDPSPVAAWLASASATDACGGPVTLLKTYTPPPGNDETVVVTFTATDACGKTNTAQKSFMVKDTIAPTVGCPPDMVVPGDPGQASTVVVYASPTVTDNCVGVSFVQIAGLVSGEPFPIGTTTNTFLATDAAGLTASCSFDVTVTDGVKPTIDCPADIEQQTDPNSCTAVVNFTVSASDNLPGVTWTADPPSGSTFVKGSTTVHVVAIDAAGNTAECQFTVTVKDQQKPTITLIGPDPLMVECRGMAPQTPSVGWADPGASVTDNCDGSTGPIMATGAVNTSLPDTYKVTYTATDSSGNAADPVTRTVRVIDTTPPVITLNGPAEMTVECHGTFTDPGATATDACAGSLGPAAATGDVDATTPGTYTITYNAHDTGGNQAEPVTRRVHVADTVPPVITLLGPNPLRVPQGEPFVDPGATVSDGCATGLAAGVSGTVNVDVPGTYVLTYTVSDGAIEADPVARTVLVNHAPFAQSGTATVPHRSSAGVDIDLKAFVTDADGDPLTYSAGTATHGTVTVNPVTGLAHYTPVADNDTVGSDAFPYSADDRLNTGAANITVTLTNSPPAATVTLSPMEPRAGETITATATGADEDGDPVTLAYAWYRNSARVTDQTAATYTGPGARGDTIEVRAVPNDGHGEGAAATASVTVLGTAPTALLSEAADPAKEYGDETVQYSDPIREGLLLVTEPDRDTVTATMAGAPPNITLVAVEPPGTNKWTLSGIANAPPGAYPVTITVSDADGSVALPFTITVLPEYGLATYTGATYVATESATSGRATVLLAAAIADITAAGPDEPGYDASAGNINKATVTFVNRDTGDILAQNVPIDLLDPSDTTVAVGSAECLVNIGAADSATLDVGIIVGGWYACDESEYDTLVSIARPIPNFVTGGGYLVNATSSGLKAGTPGLRTNFSFGVKYNKSLKNIQGRASAIVRSGASVYLIRSTAIQSLSVKPPAGAVPGKSTITSRAAIQDITNPLAPVSIDGNASLQITMTDYGEPGSRDTIVITLYNKSGGLWFSSGWSGGKPAEQALAGGNLVIR